MGRTVFLKCASIFIVNLEVLGFGVYSNIPILNFGKMEKVHFILTMGSNSTFKMGRIFAIKIGTELSFKK